MMEPAELPPMRPIPTTFPDWATSGAVGRKSNILASIHLDPDVEERLNVHLEQRWQEVVKNEVRYLEYYMDDAEYVVTGFGTAGRIALSAVRAAREEGIKVGLIRPIILNPFPEKIYDDISQRVEGMLVVEMNAGQMLEDVRKATKGRIPVEFFGRMGGVIPLPDEVLTEIHRMAKGQMTLEGHPRDRWLARLAEIMN
jgi:2-oxoglutarate ferredoxin oxidoreductase subunit alpha